MATNQVTREHRELAIKLCRGSEDGAHPFEQAWLRGGRLDGPCQLKDAAQAFADFQATIEARGGSGAPAVQPDPAEATGQVTDTEIAAVERLANDALTAIRAHGASTAPIVRWFQWKDNRGLAVFLELLRRSRVVASAVETVQPTPADVVATAGDGLVSTVVFWETPTSGWALGMSGDPRLRELGPLKPRRAVYRLERILPGGDWNSEGDD